MQFFSSWYVPLDDATLLLQYKNKRKGRGNGGRGGGKRAKRSDAWASDTLGNEDFERYYKVQRVCPEEEWDAFMASLKKHLPLTFRINGSGRFAQDLQRKLETDFLSKYSDGPLVVEGEEVNPPMALPWYPNKLAWQFDFSRFHLRRVDHLKQLHEFIKRETETGAITRQEAVSMIPPLFLDAQPHHRILDMCAAPGSKTFQLLEGLHQVSGEPSGVVIANDADTMRCNMLTHQCQRMKSPSIIVTNHEAQNFPSIVDTDPSSGDSEVMYDRILCDVPCSGDGTMRKQLDIWSKWSASNGNGLHLLQLKIALRAAELLKVGGRMVYSTCTFNPIEDEAVVAELLRRTHGALKLVSMSEKARELKFQPGLLTWKVLDNKNCWHDSFEGARNNFKIQESMFPRDDLEQLGIPLTMRFLPHQQNTGGFFIAILEKTKDMPPVVYPSGNKRMPRKKDVHVSLTVQGGKVCLHLKVLGLKNTKKIEPIKQLPVWGIRGGGIRNVVLEDGQSGTHGKWKGVDPVVPFTTEEYLSGIKSFYGIADDCHIMSNLVSRTMDNKPKKLAYISPGPKLLLQMDDGERLKLIHCGLKMFERQDSKDGKLFCPYRISQEGLPVLLPHVTKQIFYPSIGEFTAILRDRSVQLPSHLVLSSEANEDNKTGDGNQRVDTRTTFSDARALDGISTLQVGCCVAILHKDYLKELNLEEDDSLGGGLRADAPFVIPCWKGRTSINVMVARPDCEQMIDRLESAKKS